MFAYCGNNPVNRYDPNGEAFLTATICGIAVWKFAAAITGALLVGATTYAVTDSLVRNPPVLPSISLPKITIKPKAKTKDTTKDITAPPPSNGTTYYHVTSAENAAAIMWNQPNTLVGSIWEGGYVYAWKMPPSKYAIENSGAHMGVTISFKTSASFVMDTGITDPKVQMYGPVVSTVPGPIVVWDVKIVG